MKIFNILAVLGAIAIPLSLQAAGGGVVQHRRPRLSRRHSIFTPRASRRPSTR
jgi:hypothetical protein